MRVGIAISAMHGGGAEFVARTWARDLADEGHEVFVYTYEPGASSDWVPPTARHRHFPIARRAARVFVFPWWLNKMARQDDLDVLLTLLTFTNLAAIVGLRTVRPSSTRVVISERNAPTTYLPIEGRSGRLQRAVARLLYRRADGVIAISHPVAGDLVGGYRIAPERLFVVPNPVVQEIQTPTARLEGGVNVLFVGRLVPQKDPQLFVEVINELRRRGVEARGTVIGDGPLASDLRAYADRSGIALEFLGWREPWTESAGDADCLLLTSSVEGFGNVLVEAAHAHIATVACSSALGVGDAIVPGLTGEFAVSRRPSDFADAVIAATTAKPDGATEAWLRRFSSTHSSATLIRVLADTVNANGRTVA